jgi:chemotaxis protein MotB
MARRKKNQDGGGGDPSWLVTFSDLVTLLLTFFVLILSMSSMDKSILTRVNLFSNDIGFVTQRSAGRVPERIELLLKLLEEPQEVVNKPDRFKELLFHDQILPPEIDRSTLYENIIVMQEPEGLALILKDKLLFEEGRSDLTPTARQVLMAIYEVLAYSEADVNISGFSDDRESSGAQYRLSGNRALAVLDFFVQNELRQSRFSVSAYGPNLPLASNATPEGRDDNRRVSILIKTTPLFAGYQTR